MPAQQLAEESPYKYEENWECVETVFVFVDITANNYQHHHHTLQL